MDDNLAVVLRHFYLSVLIFQESPGAWVAQGLEHDIAAHGADVETAKVAFERTLAGYFTMSLKSRREPLASLPGPAPEQYWEAWRKVTERQTEKVPASDDPSIPPAYIVQAVTNESVTTIQ